MVSIDENKTSGELAVPQLDSAANEGQSDLDQIASEIAKRPGSFPGWLYSPTIPVNAGLLFKGNFGRGWASWKLKMLELLTAMIMREAESSTS